MLTTVHPESLPPPNPAPGSYEARPLLYSADKIPWKLEKRWGSSIQPGCDAAPPPAWDPRGRIWKAGKEIWCSNVDGFPQKLSTEAPVFAMACLGSLDLKSFFTNLVSGLDS
jgi:hypothetical protein